VAWFMRAGRSSGPGEPREARVGGAELGAVLDRKRRKVRVDGEVAYGAEWLEELAQQGGVSLGWMDDRRTRLREPAVDDVERPGRARAASGRRAGSC
jgi:hypothetical protein